MVHKKTKFYFYHHTAFNGERGFTLCGFYNDGLISFGMSIKHPTGDVNYIKYDGRERAVERAMKNEYKTLKVGRNKPATIFYNEVERVKLAFMYVGEVEDYNSRAIKTSEQEIKNLKLEKMFVLQKFITKYKATDK
jgi:hypothetical protein